MKRLKLVQSLAGIIPNRFIKFIKIFIRYPRVVILPGAPSYVEDGFATIHNADFATEPDFSRAYTHGLTTGSWSGVQWRAHVYTWFALQVFGLYGDYVECGVNRGCFARMVFDYTPLSDSQRNFYLLDTYNGIALESLSHREI